MENLRKIREHNKRKVVTKRLREYYAALVTFTADGDEWLKRAEEGLKNPTAS
jgi:hypothetical protein